MNRPAPDGAFAEFLDEAAELRRMELELLRAEMGAMCSRAVAGLGLLILAATLTLATVGLLAGALVAALIGAGLAAAPAALLAALATAALAAIAALFGRSEIRAAAAGPRRSVRALARDLALARGALR
ncbi:MAG: phage holin family protein [Pikeienuella sp.]|uniref:phage holin family protein n=1 Tax=Pikeienuella sp. TaxID=2831957 RepID=UPI0039188D96